MKAVTLLTCCHSFHTGTSGRPLSKTSSRGRRRLPSSCGDRRAAARPWLDAGLLHRCLKGVRSSAEPAAQNIEAIAALEREALHQRSPLDRFTDAITNARAARVSRRARVWFGIWIGVNVLPSHPFDPFPFNLLALIVSLEAIFLTGGVLMTQNRMTRQADKRAHLDLQVNLLAEQELTAMLQMLTALCQHAGLSSSVRDARVAQMSKETDIHVIADAIDRELGDTTAPSSAPAPRTPSPHRS